MWYNSTVSSIVASQTQTLREQKRGEIALSEHNRLQDLTLNTIYDTRTKHNGNTIDSNYTTSYLFETRRAPVQLTAPPDGPPRYSIYVFEV